MAQGVIVRVLKGRLEATEIPDGVDLVEWVEALGFKRSGMSKADASIECLRSQPIFDGLAGPMYGGADHPIRYEDGEANNILST